MLNDGTGLSLYLYVKLSLLNAILKIQAYNSIPMVKTETSSVFGEAWSF